MNGKDFISATELQEKRKAMTRQLKFFPEHYTKEFLALLGVVGKRSDIFQTCVSCEHWNHEKDECKKFNIKPPASVIVDGCSCYVDFDEIPF